MEKLLKVLVKHRVNFSVEHFANHAKVRVRRSGAWSQDGVLSCPVFLELKQMGYKVSSVRFVSGATPTAVVEYTI